MEVYKEKRGINIICKWSLQFSYLKDLIKLLNNEGIPINYYITDDIISSNLIKLGENDEIINIDNLSNKYKDKILFYEKVNNFLKIRILPLSINIKNKISSFFINLISKNILRYKTTINITKNNYEFFLAPKDNFVITFAGSWDHYYKFSSLGYETDIFIGWSPKMCDDWDKFQGCIKKLVGYPYIFNYLANKNPNKRLIEKKSEKNFKGKLKIVYPLTFSKLTSEITLKDYYYEEISLIKNIQKLLIANGVDFFVKPKPSALGDEIAELKKSFKVIGIQNRPKDNYDFFSEEYNNERHKLLQKIDGVINLGTTFGVDASIAKLPVMQIDLTESNIRKFKYLQYFQIKYKHISSYLLENKDIIYKITNLNDLELTIRDFVSDLKSKKKNFKAFKLSKNLRHLIIGTNDLNIKVKKERESKILESILNQVNK